MAPGLGGGVEPGTPSTVALKALLHVNMFLVSAPLVACGTGVMLPVVHGD